MILVLQFGAMGRAESTWTEGYYRAKVRTLDGRVWDGPASRGVDALNVVVWDGQMWILAPHGTVLLDSWKGRRVPDSVEARDLIEAGFHLRVARAGVV